MGRFDDLAHRATLGDYVYFSLRWDALWQRGTFRAAPFEYEDTRWLFISTDASRAQDSTSSTPARPPR